MALCGGIVLEEALELSFDRLLMMMMLTFENMILQNPPIICTRSVFKVSREKLSQKYCLESWHKTCVQQHKPPNICPSAQTRTSTIHHYKTEYVFLRF